jgi:hypothetical protein
MIVPMSKDTLDYSSPAAPPDGKQPVSFFLGVALAVITFAILILYFYIWHEARLRREQAENYGGFALTLFRPIAIVLSTFFLLGYFACLMSLSKRHWGNVLVSVLLAISWVLLWVLH